MKYKGLPPSPRGTQRIIKQFLWLPKELPFQLGFGCDTEGRWLEIVYIKQSVGRSILGERRWYDRYWVGEKEYQEYRREEENNGY